MPIASGRHGGETEENQNKNMFLDIINTESSHKVPKIQVRKVSVARWDEELELWEVIENKGCIWKNTGIIRNGKLYCHIEELLHLKSLGYIVGRYNTPWTMKNKEVENSYNWDSFHNQEWEEQTSNLISSMQIAELKPTFQVHFPNSGFKKSSPGDPGFILCVLWERPPSRIEAETLQKKCGRIPLKFCFVDLGRISFFSHQNFVLPTMQERENEEISGNHSISSLLAIINNDTSSKTQCSNRISIHGCHDELKSEVIEKKSDIWKNDGINQNGKLDFHIKRTLSFVDREVQLLECFDDTSLSKEENYSKLTDEKDYCSREVLVAYDHLTSLGYFVERFNSPRSIKSYRDDLNANILEESTNCDVQHDHKAEEIYTLLEDMQISGLRPTFNVYYHNSSFKKISSGAPGFIVCVIWERPPSREEAENLQNKCGNIPLKFCFVDDRHVSFFSYDKIVLPTLP